MMTQFVNCLTSLVGIRGRHSRGRRVWSRILGLLLVLAIAGCPAACPQDPKQTLITEDNREELYQSIRKGNALTYEEAQLLEAYLERNQGELGDRKLPPGRTVEELLQEQRLLAILDQSNKEGDSTASRDPQAGGGNESQPRAGGNEAAPPGGQAYSVTPKAPPAPKTAAIPSGTELQVRLNEPVSSKTNQSGDRVEMVLEKDIVVGENLLASEGSRVTAVIREAKKSGRVKGRAEMSLTLTELALGKETYLLDCNTLKFRAESGLKKDVLTTGIGGGVGGGLGALIGGKKGAVLGAILGGGGAIVALPGEEVEFAVEQLFKFIECATKKGVKLPILTQ